jgi:hypothetical protein
MAAKTITIALLRQALEVLIMGSGQSISEGIDEDGRKRFLLDPGGQTCGIEDGKLVTSDPALRDALIEILVFTDAADEDEPVEPARFLNQTSNSGEEVKAPPENQGIQEDAKKPAWQDSLLAKLLQLFDSDVLEIFGDTGVGKTIFCQAVAEEASQKGARVVYIDTEKNVGRKTRDRLAKLQGWKELRFIPGEGIKSQVKGPGLYYLYTPSLQELSTITRNLPDADLVIIDSLGMPVLVKYSRMKQNEQGHVLQEMIAIKGDLKEWAYRTGGLAIDVNQPVSDMNKTPQQIREGLWPFGDKSGFATKSVLRFWKIKDDEGKSVIEGKIHKSRDFGKGTKIVDMEITNQGTKIKILEVSQ